MNWLESTFPVGEVQAMSRRSAGPGWPQASQTRSAVAEPAVSWPWPAAHVRQASHASLPAPTLKVPLMHKVQTRLEDAVGAAVS
jgi:hypothetical protein